MGSRYSAQSKGFSLVELLVTIAIIAVGLVVVLQAFSISAKVAGFSYDLTEAALLAQDKLQELEFLISKQMLTQDLLSGSGTQGKYTWKYTLTVDPELQGYTLDTLISWQRGKKQDDLRCVSYVKK